MDNRYQAHARIDDLAIHLAKEICDLSLSEQQAAELLFSAVRTVEMRVFLGMRAPRFQERAADHRRRLAAIKLAEDEEQLRRQLAEFGIDAAAISDDGPRKGG